MRYLISLILIIVPELLFAQQSLDTLWVRVVRKLDGTTVKILDTLEFSDGTKIWSRTGLGGAGSVDSTNFQKYQDTLTFDFTRTQFNTEILKYVAKSDSNSWLPTWMDILAKNYQNSEQVIATLETERPGWGYVSKSDTTSWLATWTAIFAKHYLLPADSNLTVRRPDTSWIATRRYVDSLVVPSTYYPSNLTVTPGTLDSGTVASMYTMNDARSILVSEVTGAPGFNIQVTFAGASAFNTIELHVMYFGNPAHNVEVQLYNVGTTNWDVLGTIASGSSFLFKQYSITNPSNYVSSGNVLCRIRHTTTGNAAHDIVVDYWVAKKVPIASPAIIDHGALSGLLDNDHPQYALVADSTAWLMTKTRLDLALAGYLPLSGGTISSALTVQGTLYSDGGFQMRRATSGDWGIFYHQGAASNSNSGNLTAYFKDSGGGYDYFTQIIFGSSDITNNAEWGRILFYTREAGVWAARMQIVGSTTTFSGAIANSRTNLGVNYVSAPLSNLETAPFTQFQDVMVWMVPDSAQYYNGSAWVTYTSPPDWKSLTDNNSTTTVTIDSTHKYFRLYYNMTSRNPSYAKLWRVEQAWTNPSGEKPLSLLIEQADNGGMSTNLESLGGDSTTLGSGGSQGLYQTTRHNKNFIRVTFNVGGMTSSSAQFQPASLCAITQRAGSQGAVDGRGMPFIWDNSKNVTFTSGTIERIGTDTIDTKAAMRSFVSSYYQLKPLGSVGAEKVLKWSVTAGAAYWGNDSTGTAAGGYDGQNADSLNGKILDTLGRDLGTGKYTVPSYVPDSLKYKHLRLVGFDSTGLSIGDSTACVLSVQANKIVITRQKNRSGSSSFSGTGQRVAIYIPGATANDRYFLQTSISGTTPPSAVDTRMGVTPKTDSLVVWRPASGTSGQTFFWWRVP